MTEKLNIFQGEIEDNVTDLVNNSNASTIHPSYIATAEKAGINKVPDNLVEALNMLVPPDSALVHCILVSTNWNKNDDVFSPTETWNARKTPIFKPANKDHNGKQVDKKNQTFGVIINSNAVDNEYNLIEENPPGYFHLLTSVQLWEKYWPNMVEEVKQSINNGTQYVSMECTFGDFGYALREKDQEKIYLIDRNEKTSKFTKFLKAYKGKGEINLNGKNYQIGRWLKNIIFTGVGFVDKPANPDSIVFEDFVSHACEKEDNMFVHISAEELEQEISNTLTKNSVLNNTQIIKGDDMAKETVENKEAKASMNEQETCEALKTQIAALQSTIAELTNANAGLNKEKESMAAAMKDLEAKCKNTEDSLANAQNTLATIEKARVTEARFNELNELNAVAGVDEDSSKAKEKLGEMSKDTYAAILNMAKAAVKSTFVTQTSLPKTTDQTKTSLTKSTEASEKSNDAEVLAEAKVEVKEDVTTVVTQAVPDALQSAMVKLIEKKSNKK